MKATIYTSNTGSTARYAKQYHPTAVCAVGMGKAEIPTGDSRQKSNVPISVPLFNLQGGFDVKKLHGIYKFMMSIMVKTAGKELAENQSGQQRKKICWT